MHLHLTNLAICRRIKVPHQSSSPQLSLQWVSSKTSGPHLHQWCTVGYPLHLHRYGRQRWHRQFYSKELRWSQKTYMDHDHDRVMLKLTSLSHQNSNSDMCERVKDVFDAAIFSEWNWKSLGIQPKHLIILDGFAPALASYCMFLWLHVATVCRDFTVSRSCWVGSRSMRLSSSRWPEPDGWGWSSWTARLGLWLGCA